MARWDSLRRAEKQKLGQLDKTLGAAEQGQQEASEKAEDVGLRQTDRKNRQFDIFKWLKRK
ncbi:MAG TPA: hypothetical protein VLS92_07285 [Acidimicrobiia bacterium]|jgi:hypothetical protein|nr:hypothetical protein [Acidimicrobiia bacterium]